MANISDTRVSHFWCFTLNNPTQAAFHKLTRVHTDGELWDDRAISTGLIYTTVGYEHSKFAIDNVREMYTRNGWKLKTPHFQGVFAFDKPKTFKQVKTIFHKAHWEVCREFEASCIYCAKETIFISWGNFKNAKELWDLTKSTATASKPGGIKGGSITPPPPAALGKEALRNSEPHSSCSPYGIHLWEFARLRRGYWND